jgi:hypothetical protein
MSRPTGSKNKNLSKTQMMKITPNLVKNTFELLMTLKRQNKLTDEQILQLQHILIDMEDILSCKSLKELRRVENEIKNATA